MTWTEVTPISTVWNQSKNQYDILFDSNIEFDENVPFDGGSAWSAVTSASTLWTEVAL